MRTGTTLSGYSNHCFSRLLSGNFTANGAPPAALAQLRPGDFYRVVALGGHEPTGLARMSHRPSTIKTISSASVTPMLACFDSNWLVLNFVLSDLPGL